MSPRVSNPLFALVVACTTIGAAQDSASIPSAERPTAPVVVDGVTLFSVRGLSSYTPEMRAAEIGDAIARLASDRSIPIDSILIQETPEASILVAGGQRVLVLVDADAEIEGVSREVLIKAYRSRIAEAVESFRRDREPAVLWRAVARAAAATLALALGLWAMGRMLRWLRMILDRRYRSKVRDLGYGPISVVRGERLWHGVHRAIGFVALLATLLAGYVYLDYVLLLFPWTRALGHGLSAMLLRPLATLGTGALRYAPNVVFLVILALLTRYVLGVVRLFFRRVADGAVSLPGFETEWALPTDRIVRLLVVAFAVVIAYPYIPGSGSEAFKGITILLGLIFSIGSPSVIGNLVAGQSLAFRRAFRVGDRIKVGEHVGEVAQIRLLTTYLRSPKNEQVVIPNSLILNSEVVNYSALARDAGLILHSVVAIRYDTPWRQVEAMLLEAAARTRGLLQEPAPFVLEKTLGTFAVEYEINACCDNPRLMPFLYSALHSNILDVFNEYGVQIMTPAYEGDPDRPKVVPREEWFAAPAGPPRNQDGPNGSGQYVRFPASETTQR